MSSYDQTTRTDGLIEKLVDVIRTAKVVKGGHIFGFAATVVVGDGQGRIGVGRGKAREVPDAIQKALESRWSGLARAISTFQSRLPAAAFMIKLHQRRRKTRPC